MKTSTKAYTVGLHLLKIYRSSVFKSTRTEYILSKIYFMMSEYIIISCTYQAGIVTFQQRRDNIISE